MLKHGLSVDTIFVGLKVVWLNPWYGGKFLITYSLGFIGGVIASSVVLSLLFPKKAHAPQGSAGAGRVAP